MSRTADVSLAFCKLLLCYEAIRAREREREVFFGWHMTTESLSHSFTKTNNDDDDSRAKKKTPRLDDREETKKPKKPPLDK